MGKLDQNMRLSNLVDIHNKKNQRMSDDKITQISQRLMRSMKRLKIILKFAEKCNIYIDQNKSVVHQLTTFFNKVIDNEDDSDDDQYIEQMDEVQQFHYYFEKTVNAINIDYFFND